MKTEVLGIYSGTAFAAALLCHVVRWLLLHDARTSKLSRAADYAGPAQVATFVFLWYGISVSFTIINRWMYVDWRGGFPFPILTTGVHMVIKYLASRVAVWVRGKRPADLPRAVYWSMAAPIGVATAADVLLSNASFLFISVSFYTIAKSGSLVWILLWAAVFRLEVASCRLVLVVSFICAGLTLASWGETDFSLPGLLMVLASSCVGGFRWALTQLLQRVDSGCNDALTTVYHIAPSSALAMLPAALIQLGPVLRSEEFGAPRPLAEGALLMFCGGLVAFALILVEVQLVSLTSSLSMGVIGNIKDIVQIAIAVLVYHDQVSALNILGLVLAISGGWLYKRQRGAPAAEAGANGGGKAGSNGGGGGRNGGGPALLPYAVVSQEEADDELKVFRMQGTDWDLDADLSDGWNDLG